MKNNKGITLIALVITIIVLLILAGVSIAMLTGSNGILTQAQNASNATSTAEIEERIDMELAAIYSQVLAGEVTEFDSDYLSTINTNLAGKATASLATTTTENDTINISGTGASGHITITGTKTATVDYAGQ